MTKLIITAAVTGGEPVSRDMTPYVPCSPEEITEEVFANYLYTRGMPEPDLLIRTSGEMRISNFLLWQIAYTEIYVTNTLWPDFRRDELIQILYDYQKRERRFGVTGDQIKKAPRTGVME